MSKRAGNLYLDMASDLVEEMDTDSEISLDIHDLLPRYGPVNAYGSHLVETENEQNEDDGAAPSETQVVCFLIFQLSLKLFFILYNLNTDH